MTALSSGGELFGVLEGAEEFGIAEAVLGGGVGGAFEEVVAGNAEGVSEALEGVASGSADAAFVAADVCVVNADEFAELGLGEVPGAA